MTTRNLERVLAPRRVAIIGASGRPRAIGHLVLANMRAAGFSGTLMPVNPHETEIDGLPAYPNIAALPEDPDLAVIATPPDTVPGLIAQLADRGCAGAVVITAGFGEGGARSGVQLRRAMLEAARPSLLRIIGPNCLGIVAPGAQVNASFSSVPARAGGIACFTQSGAVAAALMDWGYAHSVGFRYVISLGDMADVDFGDLLDYVATDPETKAVLLYIESVTSARKFMSAARAAARGKPVIVVKSGRHPAASAAARSHTGALAGSDAVYDAAFRRAGLLRVRGLGDLFSAAETLSRATSPRRGERMAILTNGGGFGVLATDAWLDAGGTMATLSDATVAALDAALPPAWSHANPIDIIGDAGAERYENGLSVLQTDPGIDTILALNCPTGVASSAEAAEGLLAAWARRPKYAAPNLLACWLSANDGGAIRARFAEAGIPAFDTIESAIAGCAELAEFARNQRLLLRVPAQGEDAEPETDAMHARELIANARRPWMDPADAKQLIAAHGIPVVPVLSVATPEEAGQAAEEIGGSVALKIRSRTVLHKSDAGGVVLDLRGSAAVRAAARSMLAQIEGVEGFTVEAMAQRPGAFELIIGASVDPAFGPVILFGQGGVGVEAIGDTTLALPPLDLELARGMIGRTRIARLLQGFRGRPPVNMDALAGALVSVSRLILDHPEIVELDINPILADADGVIAVDARVKLDDPARRQPSAIVPYPRELETVETLRDGTVMRLRPIRPDDATVARRFLESVSREDIRARFHGTMRDFSGPLLLRLTQIDYDREMALIGFRDGDELPLGVVRLYTEPDQVSGEFAILVRSGLHGHGLGTALMHRIITLAKERGLSRIVGSVLRDNTRMLRLVRELGFVAEDARGDEVTMVLRLPAVVA
jgi:acetyltransferase